MRGRQRKTLSHIHLLPSCKPATPAAILAVLQEKAREFDQARSADERLTKWLNPTVSVLYALSATLGEGVGLVCVKFRLEASL